VLTRRFDVGMVNVLRG
jgi:hypothetical protein